MPAAFFVLACLASGCWIIAGTPDFHDAVAAGGAAGSVASSSSSGSGNAGGSVGVGGFGGAGPGSGGNSAGGAHSVGGAGMGGATSAPLLVFLTNTDYPVGMTGVGSLALADQICADEATAAGLGGSTFVAWLSDSSTQALDRITSDGPWQLVQGPVVFPKKSAITNPGPSVPINEDAAGLIHTAQPASVWTGTLNNGTSATYNCIDWSDSSTTEYATVGDFGSDTSKWTNTGSILDCSATRRLYCFEI